MNFSTEESKKKKKKLIIKAATGNIKTWTIRNFLFSLTLQAVRLNNQGAPLLGLAKSINYYYIFKARGHALVLYRSFNVQHTDGE